MGPEKRFGLRRLGKRKRLNHLNCSAVSLKQCVCRSGFFHLSSKSPYRSLWPFNALRPIPVNIALTDTPMQWCHTPEQSLGLKAIGVPTLHPVTCTSLRKATLFNPCLETPVSHLSPALQTGLHWLTQGAFSAIYLLIIWPSLTLGWWMASAGKAS